MHLLELSHLAVGSPTPVTVPRIPQVQRRDPLEATCRVEARASSLAIPSLWTKPLYRPSGWRFRTGASRQDRGVDPRDLGANQCGAVFEILRAVLRPQFELTG